MRVVSLLAALLMVALVPAIQAAPTYMAAAPDAADDQSNQCALVHDASLNNACDLRGMQVGYDDENLYIEATAATLTYPFAAEGTSIRMSFKDTAGKEWIIGAWNDGDGNPTKETFGSNVNPGGLKFSMDAGKRTLTATIPLSSIAADAGGAIQMTGVWTRQGSAAGQLYLVAAMDDIPNLPTIYLPAPIEVVEVIEDTGLGEVADTVYENLTSLEVHHNFTNETTADYVFNLTTFAPNGTLEAAVNGTGMVNATLADGNGTMIFNGTLGNGTIDLVDVQTGNWTLTLSYVNFNGTMDLVYTQTIDGMPAELDENGDPVDPTIDEEAPGPALALLLVALVALARRRR